MAEVASSPWRLTEEERRRGFSTTLQLISGLIGGPIAPLIVWAGEIVYERRHLLFSALTAPRQVLNLEGEGLPLKGISQRVDAASLIAQFSPKREVISFSPELTKSARAVGLRRGDPVSVVLASRTFTSTRSGLVVPARVGERVQVTVPRGDYSLAAFGSKRASLFSVRDPFTAVGGSNISQGPRQELELPLRGRSSIQAPVPSRTVPCLWCHKSVTIEALAIHTRLFCPKRPPLIACPNCNATFYFQQALQEHERTQHPFIRRYKCVLCGRDVVGVFGHTEACPFGLQLILAGKRR